MWAQDPSPTEGAEGTAAVACDAPRDALPDSSYTVVCVTPLKIKCKAASFKKLAPVNNLPWLLLWLAIGYLYFLVLYNLLSKHLPKEFLSSLKAEIMPISFGFSTASNEE